MTRRCGCGQAYFSSFSYIFQQHARPSSSPSPLLQNARPHSLCSSCCMTHSSLSGHAHVIRIKLSAARPPRHFSLPSEGRPSDPEAPPRYSRALPGLLGAKTAGTFAHLDRLGRCLLCVLCMRAFAIESFTHVCVFMLRRVITCVHT